MKDITKKVYSKSLNGTFKDLAQIPSLDGEGAEGGWGDIKSVSNKSW